MIERLVLALFTITIFVSAWLLFLVQPMFARMVLPLLGGSPNVWNTAMVFYQGVLLGGYLYAHLTTKWLSVRQQLILHLVVLLVPLGLLPIAVPAGWEPPIAASPVPWLLGMMLVAVGMPFFVISTGSPLIQRWFAATGHHEGRDPYFLYAASNLGSLLALLAYPLAMEPLFDVKTQSHLWTGGYVLWVALVAAAAWRVHRATPARGRFVLSESPAVATPPPTARRRFYWVALAFVPSSMMLSVTSYLSSEIASMPLLWVIPLALYLTTFILVFSRRQWIAPGLQARIYGILVVAQVFLIAINATEPLVVLLPLHLAAFFVAALLCHGAMAEDRPAADHLTEFYLWMSVGGVLGGIFNALVAPVVFAGIGEYPIIIFLACVMGLRSPLPGGRLRDWLRELAWPAGVAVLLLLLGWQIPQFAGRGPHTPALIFALPVLIAYFLSERRISFAFTVGVILLVSYFDVGPLGKPLFTERSFFGIHRVTVRADHEVHLLIHGKTVHGMQWTAPRMQKYPLMYYHNDGPVGEFFTACGDKLGDQVGIMGLGAGAMATYLRPDQKLTYFEIDPVVVDIAEDPRLFTYLTDCRAKWSVVLGDGRRSLLREPDGRFSLLVLDVYSSDVIPAHLLTREALALYMQKLGPDGFLLANVSNRHFDIARVLGDLAVDAGLACADFDDTDLTTDQNASGHAASHWLVLARNRTSLDPLVRQFGAKWVDTASGGRIWTDDYTNLLGTLQF